MLHFVVISSTCLYSSFIRFFPLCWNSKQYFQIHFHVYLTLFIIIYYIDIWNIWLFNPLVEFFLTIIVFLFHFSSIFLQCSYSFSLFSLSWLYLLFFKHPIYNYSMYDSLTYAILEILSLLMIVSADSFMSCFFLCLVFFVLLLSDNNLWSLSLKYWKLLSREDLLVWL